MEVARIPQDEAERLLSLRKYDILDTPPEREYDEIVRLASLICETPISTITLIDEKRQWHKARIGLADQEGSRDYAFCAHAINQDEMMVVPDATKDLRFADNPFVTGSPDIRFYAGMPLKNPDGHKLGTLCVIDRVPKKLSETQRFGLEVLSKQVVKQMELRKKVSELQQLNDSNSKLLSIVSHDLRAPLASLYGLLELHDEGDLSSDEFKGLIPKLKANFKATNQLLSNLLEWATSQFNKMEVKSRSFPLAKVADEIIQSCMTEIDKKKNKISNQIVSDCRVMGDDNKVKVILRNLILNANKFTSEGQITLSAKTNGTTVEICVTDNGVGISPQHLETIFVWNSRTSTTGTSGEKGTGLGLLVCKEFVEKNGGHMWVTSTIGEGASFYFSMPAA